MTKPIPSPSPRKRLTVEDLKEASAKLFSVDHEEVFDAIGEMRKELNRTLEQIVQVYANPKVSQPFSEQRLKSAGIEVHSAVTLNSDLIYRVLQFGNQIGPDVMIKWPWNPEMKS